MEFKEQKTNIVFGTTKLPGEDKPILYFMENGDTILKLAEFRNQESADYFDKHMLKVFGKK